MSEPNNSSTGKKLRHPAIEAFIPAIAIWTALMLVQPVADRNSAWGFLKLMLSGFSIWAGFLYIIAKLSGGGSSG